MLVQNIGSKNKGLYRKMSTSCMQHTLCFSSLSLYFKNHFNMIVPFVFMESSCRFDIDFYILSASNTDEIIPDFQIYKSL